MKKNVDIIRGVITKIENINRFLSFVTLETPNEAFVSTRRPFYSKLSEDYNGKCVDFKTAEKGLFFKIIEQEISGSNFSVAVELPSFQAKAIINNYKISRYSQNPKP